MQEPKSQPGPHAQALKESFNVVGLVTAAALSAATLNPVPLLAGLAAEAVYLGLVPRSKWYQARLAARREAASLEAREAAKREVLPQLRARQQARWVRLEGLREQIAAQGQGDPEWFAPIVARLDFLLEKWLRFAERESLFAANLEEAFQQARLAPGAVADTEEQMAARVRESYENEMAEVSARAEREASFETRTLLEKRVRVLQRRRDWAARLSQMQNSLRHQLELIEDTFGLVNDQVRARAPENVLADLETLVWQINATAQQLEEFSALESQGPGQNASATGSVPAEPSASGVVRSRDESFEA
jgi:hypothetical protein